MRTVPLSSFRLATFTLMAALLACSEARPPREDPLCTTDEPDALSGSAVLLVLELPNGDTLRSTTPVGRITAASVSQDSAELGHSAATGLRLAPAGYVDSLQPYRIGQEDSTAWIWTAGFMRYGTFDVTVAVEGRLRWDTSGVQVGRTECWRPQAARLRGRLRP